MVNEEREAEELEACSKCAYNDEGSCSCFDRASICCPYAEEEEIDIDADSNFMTHIIFEIVEYAHNNSMEPDDTLRTMSENILALLEISTFNNVK